MIEGKKRVLLMTAIMVGIFVLGLMIWSRRAAAAKDFKLQGRLGLGVETDPDDGTQDIFEVRFGAKTKRKAGIRGLVEFRADEGGREVTLHDAFADWKNEAKTSRIRFGRGKKVMGWEYDYPTADRLTIGRTAMYDFLANRDIVGRDYFVGYRWTDLRDRAADEADGEEKTHASDLDSSAANPTYLIDPNERWVLGASFHYDESRNSAIVLSAISVPAPRWRIGGWVNFQYTRGQYGNQSVDSFGAVLSTLYQTPIHRAGLEAYFGDDPYRTQVEKYYGGGRNVRAAAIKAEYGAYFGGFNPFIVPTLLWRDLDHAGDRTLELAGGLRYYVIDPLNVAFEYRYVKTVSEFDLTTEPYADKTFALAARYFF